MQLKPSITLCILYFYAFFIALPANALIKEDQLLSSRELFVKAEKVALKGDLAQLKNYKKLLKNYPLTPYLTASFLIHHIEKESPERIEHFLKQHQELPFASKLRQSWLTHLAKQKDWVLFEKYYKQTDPIKLTCLWLNHKQSSTDPNWASKVETLWLTPSSLPKQCDPVLKLWKKQKHLTDKLVWGRITAALSAGNKKFARYLIQLLPRKQQKTTRKIFNYWKKRGQFPQINNLIEKKYISTDFATILMKRFIWSKPELALERFKEFSSWLPNQEQQLTRVLALSLATSHHPAAQIWLSWAEAAKSDETLRHWHLSTLLADNNWESIIPLLETYLINWPDTEAYQYWLARAYLNQNYQKDALRLFNTLSNKRHYYGFLAASYLNVKPALNKNIQVISAAQRNKFSQIAATARAVEWFSLKRLNNARREWYLATKDLKGIDKLIAAQFAHDLGWHDRAIFLLANSPYLNHLDLRFPMPFSHLYAKNTSNFNLPRSYLLAISRQESAFQTDAHSHAGARGLMQLRPGVAKYHAQKQRLIYRGKYSLFTPEVNLRIGAAYLKSLVDNYHDDFLISTAAYNAGSTPAKKWKKTKNTMDNDVWIETIPYAETRDYVKQVLSYQLIYSEQFNEESSFLQNLVEPDLNLKQDLTLNYPVKQAID